MPASSIKSVRDAVREFGAAQTVHAVMITRRVDGGLQSSPMTCVADEHVDGEVDITRLPEAWPLLADYYGRRGQDTTTDAFRQRMESENRVLIRIGPRRVVSPSRG